MDSRLTCVTDSNIWIDLHVADLIERAFLLPFDWVAPDVVVAELTEPPGQSLVQAGLHERELSGPQVQLVVTMAARYIRPSRVDLFALVLAKEIHAMLLTGDRALREAAEQEGVSVHGTLWLLDQIVEVYQLISGLQAWEALEAMRQARRRLPMSEVEERRRRWK